MMTKEHMKERKRIAPLGISSLLSRFVLATLIPQIIAKQMPMRIIEAK